MRTAVREAASSPTITLPLKREAQKGGKIKVRLIRSGENVFRILMNEECEHEFKLHPNQSLAFDYILPSLTSYKNKPVSRSTSR